MKQYITKLPHREPTKLPLSSGVIAEGKFLFVAGQGPFDPATGTWSQGSIGEQTRLTMEAIKIIVETAGATMDDIVTCRVFLQQITEKTFAEMNEAYTKFFGVSKPARTTVGCQLLNIDVEIDCVVRMP
ncbi:RidA family protein [soil metagenome]